MEHNSTLREKLAQHEFDYPEGAWEKMGTLLDAATPTAPKAFSSRFPRWFKMAVAAAAVSALFFTLTSTAVHYPLEWVGGFNAQPTTPVTITPTESSKTLENEAKTLPATPMTSKENTTTKAMDKRAAPENEVITNATAPIVEVPKEKPKKEHAAPVDDSKVYRENKNFKNPNHITDEKTKVPSAIEY
jgi:hypothetical protein